MSFGENLIYLRKSLKITQEELAERLFVSRQTVSRWETDCNLPDVETLIRLCDIFECDLDTLVRGNGKERYGKDEKKCDEGANLRSYDKHMNAFALKISLGVWLILFGIALMLLVAIKNEIAGVAVLLGCIGIAVSDFIISGISHDEFAKRLAEVPVYPEEKTRKFKKQFPIVLSLGILLIIGAVIALIVMCQSDGFAPRGFTPESWQTFSAALFFIILSFGTFIIVFSSMIYDKYETKKLINPGAAANASQASGDEGKKEASKKINDAICATIMLSATACFLLLGFVGNLWHPGWVVFPVGGILCGISSTVCEAFSKK